MEWAADGKRVSIERQYKIRSLLTRIDWSLAPKEQEYYHLYMNFPFPNACIFIPSRGVGCEN